MKNKIGLFVNVAASAALALGLWFAFADKTDAAWLFPVCLLVAVHTVFAAVLALSEGSVTRWLVYVMSIKWYVAYHKGAGDDEGGIAIAVFFFAPILYGLIICFAVGVAIALVISPIAFLMYAANPAKFSKRSGAK